jgi:hypothetical protein
MVVSSGLAGLKRERSPKMSRSVVFVLAILLGMASSTSAQSLQWTAPAVSSPRSSANDVSIGLQVRWLTTSDKLEERAAPLLDKLPGMGACVVRDGKQLEMLLRVMQSDQRSNAGPAKAISLPSGRQCEFSPFGPNRDIQGSDAIQATVSNDRRTVEIQVSWAKWKDGTDRLPATVAAVPIGSHLLIHTRELITSGRMLPVSLWKQLTDKIFHQVRATAWHEKQQGYILISPRPVLGGETQTQTAAR